MLVEVTERCNGVAGVEMVQSAVDGVMVRRMERCGIEREELSATELKEVPKMVERQYRVRRLSEGCRARNKTKMVLRDERAPVRSKPCSGAVL